MVESSKDRLPRVKTQTFSNTITVDVLCLNVIICSEVEGFLTSNNLS